jgi:hypothetical protein
VVVSFDDADAPGYLPDDLYLDADDTVTLGASATMTHIGPTSRKASARKDDTVVVGGFTGTITTGSSKVDCG